MAKRTLSNKGRYSVLKVSGFRARMSTPQGRKKIDFHFLGGSFSGMKKPRSEEKLE